MIQTECLLVLTALIHGKSLQVWCQLQFVNPTTPVFGSSLVTTLDLQPELPMFTFAPSRVNASH